VYLVAPPTAASINEVDIDLLLRHDLTNDVPIADMLYLGDL
jgi:hypothetical protein